MSNFYYCFILSTIGARRAALFKTKTVASKVVKKVNDKKKDNKDSEEELDDQEKEIHEEEKAAKEESGDGSVKVKDESEQQNKKLVKKDEKRVKIAINLTCIHCQSKCLTVKVS